MVCIRRIYLVDQNDIYQFSPEIFNGLHTGERSVACFAFKRIRFIEAFFEFEGQVLCSAPAIKGRIIHFDKHGVVDEKTIREQVEVTLGQAFGFARRPQKVKNSVVVNAVDRFLLAKYTWTPCKAMEKLIIDGICDRIEIPEFKLLTLVR